MQDELEYLLELSAFDKTIYNLRRANIDLPGRIQHLEKEISDARKKLDDVNNAVKESESKIIENKAFIEKEQKELIKSTERLDKITTNKEYDAVHTEIAIHKQNIEEAQANTLHFQQILENLKEDKNAIQGNFAAVDEASSPELKKLHEELNSLEGRISEELKKSEIPRSKISKKIVGFYDKVKKRRNSPGVISTINWNNKVCAVCNRTQPPQRINELSKMNGLVTCETCGSILIWKDDDQYADENQMEKTETTQE